MTEAELTAAIEGPAKAVGGSVEPELTKKLLRDIGLDPASAGARPVRHRQAAAARIRAGAGLGQGEGRPASASASIAGLEQALEERANQVFDQALSEPEQAAAKRCSSASSPRARAARTRAPGSSCAETAIWPAAETFAAGNARLIVTGDEGRRPRGRGQPRGADPPLGQAARLGRREPRQPPHPRRSGRRPGEWLGKARDRDLLIQPGLRLEAARRCATSRATS